jgi:hypothetical protein
MRRRFLISPPPDSYRDGGFIPGVSEESLSKVAGRAKQKLVLSLFFKFTIYMD